MKNNIPFSKGLPIIGNLIGYQKDRLNLLLSLKAKLGPRFKIKIGPKVLTVLTSPEDIQRVMRTNIGNYYKKTNFDQLFGKGIFTTNNEEWKIQRKMIQPLFGPRFIESCAPIILEKTASNLEHYVQKNGEAEEDIYNFYAKATFEIIIATIIGIDYSQEFERLNYSLNNISDYLTRSNYLPFELPLWLNSKKKEYQRCQKYLDGIIFDSIKAQRSSNIRKSSSMISLMLQAQEQNPAIELDDQRIRDNIISLMFAGFETSALTLSWLSCVLAKNPEVQEKLYEEIKDVDPESLKIKDFDQLPYLDAVLNETMRLYPAGWAWTRLSKAEDDINGHKVKKGEIILISPYLTHRSEKIWERPNEFRPQRFLNPTSATKTPFAFFPFGGGPRICVGKQFGQIEMKLMLIHILKNYKFIGMKIPTPSPLATLQSKEGFKVSIRKR